MCLAAPLPPPACCEKFMLVSASLVHFHLAYAATTSMSSRGGVHATRAASTEANAFILPLRTGNSGHRDAFAKAFVSSSLQASNVAARESMEAALAADPLHASLVAHEGDARAGKATAVPWWW